MADGPILVQTAERNGQGRTYSFLPARWHRKKVLKWLRRTHAWLGLWGAILGFLFSFTGIVLNHRQILKIDLPRADHKTIELALPTPRPADPQAMAAWVKETLAIEQPLIRANVQKPRKMGWGDGEVWQPEMWRISFSVPHHSYTAIYWVGNSKVQVEDFRPNIWMTLNRLHRTDSVNVVWVLVTDTVAASIMVLSMTGLLLWTKLHGRRLLALALGFGSVAIAGGSYVALML
jgi:uncharacterized protein